MRSPLARASAIRFKNLTGVDPLRLIRSFAAFPLVLRDLYCYVRSAPKQGSFPFSVSDLQPCFGDRWESAGSAKGHYFHQDLWAARKIYENNPRNHIDIGSRIDGFVSHLLVFRQVTVVDVRPLTAHIKGLSFLQGDITNLQFDSESVESISSLHAIEHIGLGRYGDQVDHSGWHKALRELARVLRPGGRLYLGTPIGRERVCFNAHRVFDPKTICAAVPELALQDFAYVDDYGELHSGKLSLDHLNTLNYGCGLFEFVKQ